MSREQVDMHRLQDLVRLHREGRGARKIAQALGMSPNTERRYRHLLSEAGLLEGDPGELPTLEELRAVVGVAEPAQERSSVEAWEPWIAERLEAGAGPKAIYDWLRTEQEDFEGSYWAVKRLCRRLRRQRPPRAEDVAIPVLTGPGEVGQVDFGYVGKLIDPVDGRLRKAWVFVFVLAYSRLLFAKVAFDQKASTWLRMHADAFAFFGGAPEILVPDNLKAAVIRLAFGRGDSPALNRSYRELARHYGCRVDPTPPYSPEKKGKVEAGVKYVKRNFFAAWQPTTLTEANEGLPRWLAEVANVREHGGTGKVPREVFEALERQALLPLPAAPFEPVEWKQARVHPDSHLVFDRRMYSVPWRLLGQTVWVRATPSTVAIYADDRRVATHERRGPERRSTVEGHLPEHRAALRHRGREHWEARARTMGEDVHAFIVELFEADETLSNLRAVQAVVQLLERHPRRRAQRACARARHFGSHSYTALRDIPRKGLDTEPLPEELPLGRLERPTFARSPKDFIH